MEFCPTCANMLQVEPPHVGRRARFFCPTCPYVYSIEQKITKKERLAKKKEEAIYSKDDEMKNAPKTQATDCQEAPPFKLAMHLSVYLHV
ncbi:hypothetical protein ACLOJK_006221 [Asimina triloba]